MNITGIFILLMIVIITVYDLYCFFTGKYATISSIVRNIALRWPLFMPMLAFGMGVLYGHFFWGSTVDTIYRIFKP